MCSYARSKMSVSQELRDYLSALIQPLATNVCLVQIIQTLKEVEERFVKQNRKIYELGE